MILRTTSPTVRVPHRGLLLIFCMLACFGAQAQEEASRHKMEENSEVHQWIAWQAYRYYCSQFHNPKELRTHFSSENPDTASWDVLRAESQGGENNRVLEGTRDEDADVIYNPPPQNPFGQAYPYFRHFVAGGDGDELTTGLPDNLVGDADYDNVTPKRFFSAYEQAEHYWNGHQLDAQTSTLGISAHYTLGAEETAYWYLGHVAHLLVDMTVPAHVHNDPHPPLDNDMYESEMAEDGLFQNYGVGGGYGEPEGATPVPTGLQELFRMTADYTEEYPSCDVRGTLDGAADNEGEWPDTGRHRPDSVDGSDGLDGAELAIMGADLMPWAIEQTASLYRLFLSTVDHTDPSVAWAGHPSANLSNPVVVSSTTLSVNVTASDDRSGVKLVLYYRSLGPGRATWSSWQVYGHAPSSKPATGQDGQFGFTFTGQGDYTYGFVVKAEDGGGNQAQTSETYIRVETSPTIVLTAACYANGSVDPTYIQVPQGQDWTFTAYPNSGYTVDQWYLDGNPEQTGGSQYTVTNVQAAHWVLVSMKEENGSSGITLIEPNGGESYREGKSFSVEWRPSDAYPVRIELSLDGGGSYPYTLETSADGYQVGASRVETVRLPDDISSTTCRMRVTTTDGTRSATSASYFQIVDGWPTEGTLRNWGLNSDGQLGNGNEEDQLWPVAVSPPTNAIAVDGGREHSLALLDDGTVVAWGENSQGQLGTGDSTDRNSPTAVKGVGNQGVLTGVKAIASSGFYSLALLEDGTVASWGFNSSGELGLGDTASRYWPHIVPGVTNAVAIAAGGHESGMPGLVHSLALLADGTVMAWGANESGQLGNGTTTAGSSSPAAVAGISNAVAIAAGGRHSLALLRDGSIRAWGANFDGGLGDGTKISRSTSVPVQNLADVRLVSAGEYYSVAVDADGRSWAWGDNSDGQAGTSSSTNEYLTPQITHAGYGIVGIACGGNHTVVLYGSGGIDTWGENDNGQLGLGDTLDRDDPKEVEGGALTDDWVGFVGAGEKHTLTVVRQRKPTWTTIASDPAGMEFKVNGIIYTTPWSFPWYPDATQSVSFAAEQAVGEDAYSFTGWSDGAETSSRAVTGGGTYTALFTGHPTVVDDTATTREDTPVVIDVLGNDSSPGSVLSIANVTTPQHGSFDKNTGVYDPDDDFHGTDTFGYVAENTEGLADVGQVTITVTAVNDLPVANAAAATATAGTVLTGILTGSDVDGDSLTFSIVTDPAQGQVGLLDPLTGEFAYTPNVDATGADGFTFRAYDGQEYSAAATLSLTVSAVSDISVSGGDPAETIEAGDTTPSTGDDTAFGTIGVGSSETRTFTITNDGAASLTVTGVSVATGRRDGDWSCTQPVESSLAKGASTTFTVTFAPTSAGEQTADVTTNSDDPDEGTFSFAVGGTGDAVPIAVITAPIAGVMVFGDVVVTGTASDYDLAVWTLECEAVGRRERVLIASGTTSVQSSQLAVWDVRVLSGEYTLWLTAIDNSENETTTSVQVAVDSTGPQVRVYGNGIVVEHGDQTPSTIDDTGFGSVQLGQSLTHTFMIKNAGTVGLVLDANPVAVSDSTRSSAWAISQPADLSLEPGETVGFDITFSPQSEGNSTALVSVASNDSTPCPYQFSVAGSGEDASLLEETFDDLTVGEPPEGWENVGDASVTVEVVDSVYEGSSGRSLHFSDTITSGGAQIRRSFAQADYVILEYYMRTHNRSYEGAFLCLYGDAGADYRAVFAEGDYIGIQGDGNWVPEATQLLTYELDTWYYVRRTLDCRNNSGSFYVEEVGKPDHHAEYSIGSWSGALNTHVDEVRIFTSGGQRADAHVDSIRIDRGTVATPVASPGDGTLFAESVDVSLTCATESSTIYYTLDGRAPSPGERGSIEYVGPVHLTETTTIKAKAFRDGMVDSGILVATYTQTHTVTFDLGAHGTWTGGGELTQTVNHGAGATRPEFTVADGWTFIGWDAAFDNVTANLAVGALYNSVPVAVTDSHSVRQDAALVVSAPGVLGNDSDAEGDALTATKATDPSHGTVALAPDGSFTYTPTAGYHGSDSFTYTANDGHADSDAATVTVTVLENRVELVPVVLEAPSTVDKATARPTGIGRTYVGETFVVELWAKNADGSAKWLIVGGGDMTYDTGIMDSATNGLYHGAVYATLPQGTVDDTTGLVDEFGGGVAAGYEDIELGTSHWVRLGGVEFTATSDGDATFALAEASTVQWFRKDADGTEAVPWTNVLLVSADLTVDADPRTPDPSGDGLCNLIDYGYFLGCYGKVAGEDGWSPNGPKCDYNLDGTVNLIDYGYFLGFYGHPADEWGMPSRSRPSATRETKMDVVALAVANPDASDKLTELPTALVTATVGDTYYVEFWVKNADASPSWISVGGLDLSYGNTLVEVASLSHGGVYTNLAQGTIDQASGLVDEFGGGVAAGTTDTQLGTSHWARLGYVAVSTTAEGTATFTPSAATTAQFFRNDPFNVVDWASVDFVAASIEQVLVTYSVTFQPGAHGSIPSANSGDDYVVDVPEGDAPPAAPDVTPDGGWLFVGWDWQASRRGDAPTTITEPWLVTALYADAPPEWSVDLLLTGAIPETLTIGMRADATDGWDAGVDEQYPLPGPGQACLASDDLTLSYSADYRALGETAEFLLIACAPDEASATVSWDASGLPDGKFLSIYEVLLAGITPSRTAAMRTLIGNTARNLALTTSLDIPAGETHCYVIRYGDDLVFDLAFERGWNLISLPIEPNDQRVEAVLDDSAVRDETGGALRDGLRGTITSRDVWTWHGQGYASVAEICACTGYWVHASDATVLLVKGSPAGQNSWSLLRGWNQRGVEIPYRVPTDGRIVGVLWWWDALHLRYVPAEGSLLPGRGCWINFSEDGQLPMPAK